MGEGPDMEILKKLALFTVATIVVGYLIVWSLDAFGFRSPIFALLVNWLAMSWVAVTTQAVYFPFPSKYYDIKPFEQTGRVYERLGIRLFKKAVGRGPLTIFSPTLRFPKGKTISALRYLDHEMRKAETGHMFIFTLMVWVTAYALVMAWFDAAGWILGFNLIFNGYPVMLQRYNRIRLQALVQRRGAAIWEDSAQKNPETAPDPSH